MDNLEKSGLIEKTLEKACCRTLSQSLLPTRFDPQRLNEHIRDAFLLDRHTVKWMSPESDPIIRVDRARPNFAREKLKLRQVNFAKAVESDPERQDNVLRHIVQRAEGKESRCHRNVLSRLSTCWTSRSKNWWHVAGNHGGYLPESGTPAFPPGFLLQPETQAIDFQLRINERKDFQDLCRKDEWFGLRVVIRRGGRGIWTSAAGMASKTSGNRRERFFKRVVNSQFARESIVTPRKAKVA